MTGIEGATRLRAEAYNELTLNILPFWMNKAIDHEYGGFIGQINGLGEVVKEADKGGIINARILWTFSAAYNLLQNDDCLKAATTSRDYILKYFFDEIHGGTYWKITYNGKPADTKKQIYSQAFFIYALTEYYKATGDQICLEKAVSLYQLIEQHSFDRKLNGYLEAFSCDWNLLDDLRLSDKDDNEKITTNTHLHILEAYANLYRVWKDESLEYQLSNLVSIFLDKIVHANSNHLMLFFDDNWKSRSSLISYGHDIEASWLIYDAAKALDDAELIKKAGQSCIDLAKASLEGLQNDGSMIYEIDESRNIVDRDRHWWPQAETVVGLINLYELSGDPSYFQKAIKCWEYIMQNLVDRVNGEWYWSIKNGKPNLEDDKAGFWKCPYHNARACLEILKRC